MKIFEKFRTRIALGRITKNEASRKVDVKLTRPLTARNLAMMASPADEASYDYIVQRLEQWRAKDKSVKALFWFDSKQVPLWVNTQLAYAIHICRKDVGFFFAPSPAISTPFVEQPFELLINIASPRCLPLLYLATQSKATFRAGFSDGTLFFHDFTLLPGATPEANMNLETLIHQLNQLNS